MRNVMKFGVISLTVCMMFVSCGTNNDPVDDDPGGSSGSGVPGAVSVFTADSEDPGEVTLRWGRPMDQGNSNITKYQVQRNQAGGGTWIDVAAPSGITVSYTFKGLTNGTEYTFKVRAVNSQGYGPESTQKATPINPAAVPSSPRNFNGVVEETSVALSWTAPANLNGTTITGYQVSKDGGMNWVTASSNTGHTFTGLTANTTYTFRVRAMTANGPGDYAEKEIKTTGAQQSTFDITKLPTNVEVVYTVSYPMTQIYTLIKVGDEYYSESKMMGMTIEMFYLKKTGDTWTKYGKDMGSSWTQKATYSATTFASAVVSSDFFGRLVEPNDGANADYNSPQAVSGGSETIAGIPTNKKTLTTNVATFTYWRDPVTTLFLKYEQKMKDSSGTGQTIECTSWKTTGVNLPDISL